MFVIRESVVMTVAVNPGDGIYVDAYRVVEHGDEFDEPRLERQTFVRDSHVQHIGEIEPAKEPDEQAIYETYRHSEYEASIGTGSKTGGNEM
jgi:hypothetical protein